MKLYYTIGEVAEMFDVSNSLIRYWEAEFDILKPEKNKKGDRRFKEKDLASFRIIHHLVKEKGYTLEGAKKAIKERKKDLYAKFRVIENLKEVKSYLLDLRNHA